MPAPTLAKVVAVVHGPVPPGTAPDDAVRCAVYRPHPTEPAPGTRAGVTVVHAWLEPDARTDPRTWSDHPVDAWLVDEWIAPARPGEPWPDPEVGVTGPGVVHLPTVVRRADLTHARMVDHWRTVHAPLVARHDPGVARYVQNVVTAPLTPDAPAVDGMAQLHFRSLADFRERSRASDVGRSVVTADVAAFLDRSAGWRILATETWERT